MSQLSHNVCQRLAVTVSGDPLFDEEHTVQFLSVKKVPPPAGNNGLDRYRIIISDGVHFLQAMLATQLNHFVNDEQVGKNSVVVMEKVTCNTVGEKRLVVILALRVVSRDEEKIGEPTAVPPGVAPPPPSALAQQATRLAGPSGQGSRAVFPIEGLSPYQSNWTIKARVTQKSDIKTWSNQRGEGKLFNVTLMDESAEIKATGFNSVVDDLYDRLEEGKVYFISKARVNLAKKKFSQLPNDYELSLERNTEIEECHETVNLPQVKYAFVPLAQLESLPKDSNCDVIGVVTNVSELSEITAKTGRPLQKKELTLVDKSQFSVRLTLWGKQAEQYNIKDAPILAFKGVRVGDFGGRSLSMSGSSSMAVNPDIDEAFVLRGWYDAGGNNTSFQSHNAMSSGAGTGLSFDRANIRSLNEVKDSQLGMSDKADYFSARATIMHIKADNISYPACPSPNCNKKVTESHDGWRCEKCERTYEKPEHRYMVSMAVADWSGQAWLQGFNDAGLAVFGMTANELLDIKERDQSAFDLVMLKANSSTFNFSCRAKQDMYNDQVRVRYGISKIMGLDYREEATFLRDLLHTPWAQ